MKYGHTIMDQLCNTYMFILSLLPDSRSERKPLKSHWWAAH